MSRSTIKEINKRLIRRQWRKMPVADSFKPFYKAKVTLNHRKMECLKDSYKSSIWKLEIKANEKSVPIILKISKQLSKKRPESEIEKNIYRKAPKVLQPFMPEIYVTKRNVNGHDLWAFMEYIKPVKGQVKYTPDHFSNIIPTLAKLHASTMGRQFTQHEHIFAGWLPRFDSKEMIQERIQINKQTIVYLDQAMTVPTLKVLLKPYYSLLQKLLNQGPEYFPEVSKAGMSIIHGDLHTANMACHNVMEKEWKLKFIDWEGAKFAPCWFDLVNLIGVFLAYRREWKDEEEEITRRSARLYANEMRKNGVVFKTDPMKLYQMAYLKRILEKSLYLQLNWAVTGKKEAKLLPVLLEKIKVMGKQLGLY
ncbi:aminoglycoside phosphotransferase family protein [Paenibacillus anaericanus]|uniref:Aminoglycoside phosphotransferase family protein n=1 Tax=Paenibacillus anaericanus TaxID=170367 RepID=A0A433YFY8_9BACL|nr:aminoglycoside phosphotransferase family protein [Paenibacillus anaericanus]RUT48751.1 aminoglycoside phosphotransferase family protein [Paenibacillus anaericanus]